MRSGCSSSARWTPSPPAATVPDVRGNQRRSGRSSGRDRTLPESNSPNRKRMSNMPFTARSRSDSLSSPCFTASIAAAVTNPFGRPSAIMSVPAASWSAQASAAVLLQWCKSGHCRLLCDPTSVTAAPVKPHSPRRTVLSSHLSQAAGTSLLPS